ncbi:MAG: hypothetical protein KGJ79_09475 [Alphaproteobacteria bacterium]|nr:hypothetical protein [Alphaproteobacteria bacterium]MDE2111360.1 hypothetical protein [Alphaproteobacteria bacterium]MDE2495587.1 hypothetical protein [Alphaproteobacteria bacterium]
MNRHAEKPKVMVALAKGHARRVHPLKHGRVKAAAKAATEKVAPHEGKALEKLVHDAYVRRACQP